MSYRLHHGDCQQFLASEPAGKYDLLLIDPPYRTTNLAFDKAPALDWAAWWPEAWRVLKPAGVVVCFAADLFTVDMIQGQREYYRYRLVWEKSSPQGFFDANRRPMRTHEDVLVFAQRPSEWTYNPQMTTAVANKGAVRNRTQASHYGAAGPNSWTDNGQRYPTSVLSFGSIKKQESLHPTQKPLDLLRWLLRTYSNPGDTVLDCFAGSGSTLHACLLEGRHGVGVELDPAYYAIAEKRLQAVAAKPTLFTCCP